MLDLPMLPFTNTLCGPKSFPGRQAREASTLAQLWDLTVKQLRSKREGSIGSRKKSLRDSNSRAALKEQLSFVQESYEDQSSNDLTWPSSEAMDHKTDMMMFDDLDNDDMYFD
jgi:hypothetical protein